MESNLLVQVNIALRMGCVEYGCYVEEDKVDILFWG